MENLKTENLINNVKNLYQNGNLAKISITDKDGRQVSYRYAGADFFLRTVWETNSVDYTYCRYCNTFGHEDNIEHAEFVNFETILETLHNDDYIEVFKLELA